MMLVEIGDEAVVTGREETRVSKKEESITVPKRVLKEILERLGQVERKLRKSDF